MDTAAAKKVAAVGKGNTLRKAVEMAELESRELESMLKIFSGLNTGP